MEIAAAVRKIAIEAGFEILDTTALPGRTASYAPIPAVLDQRVADRLKERNPDGLYSHQSLALELSAGGADICLATSTASGKSLAFQTAALDLLLRDRFAKVVALYPAKALIQDQIEKWRSVLDPFGMRFGFIDGTVPVDHRTEILSSSRVVLMTPDVMHSWLMGRIGERPIHDFLHRLRLLILDEAHVYDGVFGTNMAYLLRRLEAVAAPHRLIVSTATIGDPGQFVARLTGRSVAVVAADRDGSASPQKTVLRIKPSGTDGFESLVALLVALSNLDASHFLAFGDSRKMIERVVAATLRARKPTTEAENAEGDDNDPDPDVTEGLARILPYRAGYEPCDRHEIQRALSDGTLSGVVSTSALEMGLDIGEIDTVVMLNAPLDIKSFWQRLGRAGRRRDAVCLVVDGEGTMGSLDEYLSRPVEPSWLYLENRYIQYANALCAAAELSAVGKSPAAEPAFAALPSSFVPFVENELNPVDVVPNDLYPLKQRAQAGPHREFYLRSATEQEFKVGDVRGTPLGKLSFSQALREAYPGAVHYYMARPYRVFGFNYRTGEIKVKRCRQWTTRPQAQSVVFPRFQGGVLNLLRSQDAMVAEVELQVSERVVGFVEQRGKVKSEHLYGPGSEYYQKPITRFFETTGVCWHFPERFAVSDAMAGRLLEAFCVEFGIQKRDLGVGAFRTTSNPHAPAATAGVCIYDATNGSLRLTQMLGAGFAQVVDRAIVIAEERSEPLGTFTELRALSALVANLQQVGVHSGAELPLQDTEWVTVVAAGQRAVYSSPDGALEVTVIGHRYTPHGLMYDLAPVKPGTRWLVIGTDIRPINGQTAPALFNVMTGEVRDQRSAA